MTPEQLILSFLQQAKESRIATVVFAAFERDKQMVFRSNHTLANDAAKAAMVLKFMAFDDRAIAAAAETVHQTLNPGKLWEKLSKEEQQKYLEAARTGLSLAIAVATANAPLVEPPKTIV